MTWALSWFRQNLSGLSGLNLSNLIYVMPGTYGDAVTENIASSLGFKGVRGTGSLTSTWVRGGADATLAKGYDGFNILSQGVVPNYQKSELRADAKPGQPGCVQERAVGKADRVLLACERIAAG